MDDEIRFVHREETFNDLAVRELAKSRSSCICRLQFGSCTKQECQTCSIGREYRNCYSQMNDYDKARLAKYVSENYVRDSAQPGKWMTYNGLCRYTAKWFIIAIICLLILFLPLALLAPGNEPSRRPVQISNETHEHIVVTIKLTQKYINDLNKDGKINCIDYACGFKMIWDSIYPEQANDCIIIRNKSLTLNHLYNGIYEGNSIVYVEPWTNDPYNYDMAQIWGYKWNPRYNKYDETDRWLSEVRK